LTVSFGVGQWEWLALAPAVLFASVPLVMLLGQLRRTWRQRVRRPFIGPLFWYELTRTARRGRDAWLRCAYALLLLGVLFWVHADWLVRHGLDPWDLFAPTSMTTHEMTRFANSFFEAYMQFQFVVVVLLTPLFTAGAIAEEKERRTLEFLFTTDLTDREVVLSKLTARLAGLALLLLTGMPVLSLMELLGGIDPQLVLAFFAATAATLFSLGSISVLASIVAKTYLQAVLLSFVWIVGFYGLGCCWLGNCALPFAFVGGALFGAGPEPTIPVFFYAYAVAQGLVALLFCRWAISNLRTALVQPVPYAAPRRYVETANDPPIVEPSVLIARAPVGDRAMLWKELSYEQNVNYPPRPPRGKWQKGDLIAAGMLLIMYVGYCDFFLQSASTLWAGGANGVVRSLAVPACCLVFLIVPLRAAVSISRERERRTLESLLTTPLGREEILFAKWLGSLLSAHFFWAGLAIFLVIAALTGGLHVLAVPLLALACAVYAGLLVCVGLWFSLVSQTTLRATVFTLLVTLLVGVGPWLLAYSGEAVLVSFLPVPLAQGIGRLLTYGLTPPVALYVLAFPPGEFWNSQGTFFAEELLWAVVGLLVYALAGRLLWRWTLARFRAETGPAPRR
jgi:ABC-type transport system involved in multi-copper enzyme maturation permease subunit